ncbi:MAG: ATP-binding protein, partial [Alphaproteobacteria bacterium]
GNAIKFTPPSGSVLIKAGVDPVDGAFVIVVSDTGIGIDPADLPLVMSRYGQVRGSQPNPEAGTGLGLPLTQKIVHALGGTLEVRSRSRIGTAVTLRFPATLIVPPDAAKPLRKATRR